MFPRCLPVHAVKTLTYHFRHRRPVFIFRYAPCIFLLLDLYFVFQLSNYDRKSVWNSNGIAAQELQHLWGTNIGTNPVRIVFILRIGVETSQKTNCDVCYKTVSQVSRQNCRGLQVGVMATLVAGCFYLDNQSLNYMKIRVDSKSNRERVNFKTLIQIAESVTL